MRFSLSLKILWYYKVLIIIIINNNFFIDWNVCGMITFSCRTIAHDILWKQHTAATPLGRFMDPGLIPTWHVPFVKIISTSAFPWPSHCGFLCSIDVYVWICVYVCVYACTPCTLWRGLLLFTCVRRCVDIFIGANHKKSVMMMMIQSACRTK